MIENTNYNSYLLKRWDDEALKLRINVLSSIPGIGVSRASVLIEHFGTIASVLTSNKRELMEIDSINEEIANKILEIVNN